MIRGLGRRQWLALAGTTGASALLPRTLHASSPADELRIVFYVSAHGTVWDRFAMRGPGGPLDQDWDYALAGQSAADFSDILRPLHAHRERMLVVDGVSLPTVGVPQIPGGPNEHERGHATVLTGSLPRMVSGSLAQAHSASVDQLLADHLASTAPLTPYRSLEFGGKLWSEISYDQRGAPLPRSNDLRASFERLFGSRTNRPKGTSALDLVARRFQTLNPRLGFDDRLELDRHFSLVRDLERRLDFADALDCETPADPGQPPAIDSVEYPGWQADGMLRLAAVALACGLTRIITWQDEGVEMNILGHLGGDIHQEGAHAVHSDPRAREIMVQYHTWHARRLALFLDQLQQTRVGEHSLLDRTLVVWINELGDGAHAWDRMPTVIFGGGSTFQSGRYLHLAQRDLVPGFQPTRIGPSHNRLLVSLAGAFGLEVDRVGVASVPREGGGEVDCRGPLAGLR